MRKLIFIILYLISIFYLQAQENDSIKSTDSIFVQKAKSPLSLNGEVTAWSVFQFAKPVNTQVAVRFVPTLTGSWNVYPKTKFDFEASLQMNGTLNFAGTQFDTATYVLKPYRVWARYSGTNWEVRAGLQQINFGSAKLFRPLMWFDEMDPRDPLKLTNGVYGVLGKYFFENNANIWLWTLIGNKNTKGFEFMGTAQWTPEMGGRAQIPVGPGELAFSTDFRKANVQSYLSSVPDGTYLDEKRFGLDGHWDLGLGLWFESSAGVFDKNNFSIPRFQDLWNVGADYTIPVGAGLGATVEYFRYHSGDEIWKNGTVLNILGSMLSTPVSLTDNVSVMVFYVNEAKAWFNYLSYSRTYDNWQIYLMGFWNPDLNLFFAENMSGKNLFSGKGIQLMVNYNF